MLSERHQEIIEAAGQLDAATEYTAEDKPKVDILNEWLQSAGKEPTTAAERDEAWAAMLSMVAEEGAADAAPEPVPDLEKVSIVVTDAPMNPVPLYIHGLGAWSLRVNGPAQILPREALSALDNANITYQEV